MEFHITAGGGWIDKKNLTNNDVIKLVTEAVEMEGQNGKQIVAKALVKGGEPDPKNIAINRPSMAALIDAFGKESKSWMNHPLGVYTEATRIGGKAGVSLYLIPEGYEAGNDKQGYLVVTRKGNKVEVQSVADMDFSSKEDEINPEAIPF